MAGKSPWAGVEFEDQDLTKALKAFQINRTMYVDEFSTEEDFENMMVSVGNTTELFEKIPAKAKVEVDTLEGDMVDVDLHFKSVNDFKRGNLIQMVEVLREQSETADLLEHFLKLFSKGRKWGEVCEDPEAKAAFIQRIDAVLALLD